MEDAIKFNNRRKAFGLARVIYWVYTEFLQSDRPIEILPSDEEKEWRSYVVVRFQYKTSNITLHVYDDETVFVYKDSYDKVLIMPETGISWDDAARYIRGKLSYFEVR